MKIPSNMTEHEVTEVMRRVCERSAHKYTFYGYETKDMIQEANIICIEALERYDEARPLENFLAANLSNRLKNFVRDNHFIACSDENRARVYQPAQLDNDNSVQHWIDVRLHWLDQIDRDSIFKIIDKELPASMRLDYLKMQNDVYIPKSRREEIVEKIQEILEDYGYYEEGQDF
jgi:DNA-directed RNA polymerase specialized sigma24 family protein